MRKFIVIVALAVVVLGIAGFGLGWFKFVSAPYAQEVDMAGQTERDEFLAKSETRFKAMDLNLAELKAKAAAKDGFAVVKLKLNQSIGELNNKTMAARLELQKLRSARPEQWHVLKTHLDGSLQELEASFEKVFSRFMNEWTLIARARCLAI